MVDLHRLLDRVGSRLSGIQGGIRILEDHLDVPAGRFPVVDRHVPEILSVIGDRSAGRLVELYKAAAQCGLSASGLTDDS